MEILHDDKDRDAGIEAFSTVVPKGPARELGNARELHLLQFLKGE